MKAHAVIALLPIIVKRNSIFLKVSSGERKSNSALVRKRIKNNKSTIKNGSLFFGHRKFNAL